jgi:hypothetical protein
MEIVRGIVFENTASCWSRKSELSETIRSGYKKEESYKRRVLYKRRMHSMKYREDNSGYRLYYMIFIPMHLFHERVPLRTIQGRRRK